MIAVVRRLALRVLEQKGDFDMARAGWIADYKDPESFLGISRKASGNNYANFNNPEFEALMDKAAAAGGNAAERAKKLRLAAPGCAAMIGRLAELDGRARGRRGCA